MEKDFIKGIIENILLVSEERVQVSQLMNLFDESVTRKEVEEAVRELVTDYGTRSFNIIPIAGGYILSTNRRYRQYVEDYLRIERKSKLSNAAMEVLSIVAYKQPVTRIEIDHIRGVDSSHIVRTLVERKFVKPVGKKDVPGKPLMFGTTDMFLKHFGLDSLKDLKQFKEFEEIMQQEGDEGN